MYTTSFVCRTAGQRDDYYRSAVAGRMVYLAEQTKQSYTELCVEKSCIIHPNGVWNRRNSYGMEKVRGPETSCHLSISHQCNLLSHCYNLLSNLCISLPRFCMPFFAACCQVVGHVHVLPHISFLTPSIIPLYSCIDVHVCGEMELQVVHVLMCVAGNVFFSK